MAFEDDLSVFTDVSVFGDTATAVADNGAYVSVPVIFDAAYQSLLGGGLVESNQPQALLRSVDADQLPHGKTLTVRGVDYTVVQVEPDGTGMTRLVLELAA